MRKNPIPLPIPSYAVDLLLAAKCVIHQEPPPERLARLADAVSLFEDSMPLDDAGRIVQIQPVGGRADE